MDFEQLARLMAERRAVYPKSYTPGQPLDRKTIEKLLENANWAPTHKRTEPWRFHVLHTEEVRRRFGEFAVKAHADAGSPLPPPKAVRTTEAPMRAACVIVLGMHRPPDAAVPEWEDVAAVACAVQNLWLSCSALGLGAYWSTPKNVMARMGEFLSLGQHEVCLGLFYIGFSDGPVGPGTRGNAEDKTHWY